MKSIPPDINIPKHRASHSLPEVLRILDGRNRVSADIAADGVTRLRNPDRLMSSGFLCSFKSVREQRLALADSIGHIVLKVRVRVHADPVELVYKDAARCVLPRCPRVDVSEKSTV